MNLLAWSVRGSLCILGAAFVLSSCVYEDDAGRVRGKPYRAYMVGKPYEINGHWYYPRENLNYSRTGIASWYGGDFDGKRTANGEIYDKYAMTAAHPTLPMPTMVRVTNLSNGRNVVVRINDRGPYHDGRIIDLSRRAAERLDMRRDGTARVRVTVLREASLRLKNRALAQMDQTNARRKGEVAELPPISEQRRRYIAQHNSSATDRGVRTESAGRPQSHRSSSTAANAGSLSRIAPGAGPGRVGRPTDLNASPSATGGRKYYVQVGAYTEQGYATRTGARLAKVARTWIAVYRIDDATYYRVRLGPLRSRSAGRRLLTRVHKMGYRDARIVVE